MRRKRGQSILEYTLLITAVVLVIVWGANNIIGAKAKTQMDAAGTMLDTANTKLTASVGN